MKKERKVIEQNAIVVFDGDVNTSKLNELFQDFLGDIIIFGSITQNEESLSIKCDNLYVMGRLSCIDVIVGGNLYVEGDIDCCDIKVNGCICCSGLIDSFEINVAEDLYAKGYIITNGYDINVGGELICDDAIEAAEIVVLQRMRMKGMIKADSISVG